MKNPQYTDCDDDKPPYYEWHHTDAAKTVKTVDYFESYDYIKGQWRGVSPVGKTQYFDAKTG